MPDTPNSHTLRLNDQGMVPVVTKDHPMTAPIAASVSFAAVTEPTTPDRISSARVVRGSGAAPARRASPMAEMILSECTRSGSALCRRSADSRQSMLA